MTKELSKGFTGIEINGVRFSNISEMLQYMDKQRERITELEKENAELEQEVLEVRQHLSLTEGEWGKDLYKQIHYKTQLTKAKELLAKWVKLCKPKLEGYPIPPIQEQTEQFLNSEVEK